MGDIEITRWLESLGLGRYAALFAENEIDREILPDLTGDDLEKLGIPLGPRKKLLKAIASLVRAEAADGLQSQAVPEPARVHPEAERRQLSVLFCDLVGSTELAARLDPEDLGAIMRSYQTRCAEVIARWGGRVAKYMGDGVLAYFGYPLAHEDDAERAVRSGLELVQAVAGIAAADRPLAARIGIATGMVMVGDLVGEGAAREESVVGETPNLAARLQELAEPGAVVIAQSTRQLLGGLFEYASLGHRALKGFARPVEAWRVLGEGLVESRFEALHGDHLVGLIGRDHEVGLLVDRWERAKEGEGQVVLLSGEPGIGKSRVVRALRERLAGQPLMPLSFYCSPHHTNTALHPAITLLERAAEFSRDDRMEVRLDKLETLLSRGTDAVAEAVPLVAALLGMETGERYPGLALSPQRQKQRTLEVLVDQVEGLAAREPVLAVFEDVHWVDPTTLEMLELLIERAQHLPVLVLITFRPEFRTSWPGHAHVTHLSLSRLTRRHGQALVEAVTGGKVLPDAVLDQILTKTDGVPLFVEELTKTVVESGLLTDLGDRYVLAGPLAPLAIPATLQDSLMARLDRLAQVKEVAQIGAVIGREFAHELLAAVSRLPGDELAGALDQLVAAGLIFRRGIPPEATYSFKHALVQDAAYQSLLKTKRQQLHARVAELLEERFPATAKATPEVLAHHYTEAGMAPRAVPRWSEAGQVAMGRPAYSEAIAHLSRGLELRDQVSDPHQRASFEISLQLMLGAAIEASRGPVEEVERIYARAQALCEQIEDEQRLFVALWGRWYVESQRMNFEVGRGLVDDLLRLAQRQGQDDLLLQAHHAGWTTALYGGELQLCNDQAERGIALYDPDRHREQAAVFGAHDAGVCCRCHAGLSLWLLGHPDRSLRRAQEALALATRLAHPFSLCQALFISSVIRQFRGDVDGAHAFAERLLSTARELGVPVFRESGMVLLGWSMAVQGEAERGLPQVQAGLDALRAMEAGLRRSYFLWLLADSCARAGEYGRGLEVLADASAFMVARGEHWWEPEIHRLRGELLVRRSPQNRGEAEAAFVRAMETARLQSAKALELRAATSLARLWADQRKRVQAHDLIAPVYGWFTEGFDTADLKAAKALLDELRCAPAVSVRRGGGSGRK